jgi:hypothetical protein
MPTNSRKRTAPAARRSITDRLRDLATRPADASRSVPLTDLLDGRTAHAGDELAAAFRFDEPLVRAAHVVGPADFQDRARSGGRVPDTDRAAATRARVGDVADRFGLPVVVDPNVPDNTVVIVAAAPRPPARPVGLAQIVAELLDECATDDGVDALKHTPGIPGSAVMNPLSRAIAHATGGQCWIGDEHRYAVVQRGDALARVELPGRLQGLLDSIELQPDLYRGVRVPA